MSGGIDRKSSSNCLTCRAMGTYACTAVVHRQYGCCFFFFLAVDFVLMRLIIARTNVYILILNIGIALRSRKAQRFLFVPTFFHPPGTPFLGVAPPLATLLQQYIHDLVQNSARIKKSCVINRTKTHTRSTCWLLKLSFKRTTRTGLDTELTHFSEF